MICPQCRNKVRDGASFCDACGKAMSGVSNEPAAPIVQLLADEKYCSSCGSVIKKIAEICPKCGTPTGKRKGILIALIFGALFTMGIATLWVFIIRDIIRYGGNFFHYFDQIKWTVLFIIITAGSLAGLILNIIARNELMIVVGLEKLKLEGKVKVTNETDIVREFKELIEKFVLASGIAYIFGANPISAIICFVEYFDIKSSTKNASTITALATSLRRVN